MPDLEQQLLALIGKHGARGILVDTNVLLLYLFGQFQPDAVGRRKRLERYSAEDADLVIQFLGKFKHILTTQHVLAETSNLARQIVGGAQRLAFSQALYPLFCLNTPASFRPCAVDGLSISIEVFVRLGLTDAGIATLVGADTLLLTDDLDLYLAAVSTGGDAINFTHMREAAGTV